MQLNKNYEAEIHLKDLVFHVLYRWRSILTVALICAVLLGGYKFFSMNRVAGPVQTAVQDAEPTEEELEIKRRADDKVKQISELETYLNESTYIQLSYQGVWTASCKYLVKPDSSVLEELPLGYSADPADHILAAYTYPLSGITEKELVEFFNTEKQEYANELVETEIDTDENSVTVSAKGATKEDAQKELAFINNKITEISTEAQKINAHTLINAGESIVLATDDALKGKRTELTSALDQYKKDLQSIQQQAEVIGTSGKAKISKKEVVKFAILGFFAGAFLMICIYAINYIFRDRLAHGDSLSEQLNLPIFGEFSKSGSIHRDKGLDKLLAKWEQGKNKTEQKTVYDNICALIAEQRNTNHILLISTLSEDKLNPVREALSTRLPESAFEIKGSFLKNSDAISEAAKAPAVILVEEKNVSMNKEIERMAETLQISQANVIGAIVL